ncbi:MAG: pyrroline-5-carboxylate reductase [Candidatus Omnitrophota bacterium]|nr:MAG: pyrroline-5-carboxylate reductase [Candidatus Omnitrophota bacterium]
MKIGIIGCGNMGSALLRGIIARGYVKRANILISDKDRKKLTSLRARFKVSAASSNSQLIEKCNVIILAVKPQDAGAALQDVALPLKGKLLISICAGITTRKLQQQLGKVAVVRVMPNMPALISMGISALSGGKYATSRDKKIAASIFSCVGEVVEIKEGLMDAATAISGSGPAYFFYLAQKMIEKAGKLGIPKALAHELVVKTALGSVLLMDQSKVTPEFLRERVTSRGGTTEAAFNVFKKAGLDKTLERAFEAAAKRARELEGEK